MATHDCRLANIFVRRFDLRLRVPDALHAAICRRLGMRLVTLDRRLAAAARTLEIDVLVPVE
ncbi:MAG TPA: PIN domain-containing protein [Acetobacteraceae bacterium]